MTNDELHNHVATAAGVRADRNAAQPRVELWKGETSILVEQEHVAEMIAQGFAPLGAVHLPVMLSEARALINELPRLLGGLETILEDGIIATDELAPYAAFERGWAAASAKVAELMATAANVYPVAQGKTVTMHKTIPAAEGGGSPREEEIQVDPSQVDEYRQRGYAARRV